MGALRAQILQCVSAGGWLSERSVACAGADHTITFGWPSRQRSQQPAGIGRPHHPHHTV
eukprot:SAG25_NODE_4777_length_750_cov_6.431644_1_plen_58_part_01